MDTQDVSLENGDLLIAATDIEEATLDFRKGISGVGRILHCDHAMRVKRELWTGEHGLVVGMAIDPATATLYSTNPQGLQFRAVRPVRRTPARPPVPAAPALGKSGLRRGRARDRRRPFPARRRAGRFTWRWQAGPLQSADRRGGVLRRRHRRRAAAANIASATSRSHRTAVPFSTSRRPAAACCAMTSKRNGS